ncbi:hypothetical protein BDY21DRAFT_220062 [Lineolata rhizophorae]|uniref:Thioesterase domain-containing protein n=1 Tax=Lineolata rhizophorae TaxID=578093 RepID=A0A6A6P3W0_9PEZI|nr:hypothetical protein BDY21DRAFT_220062 [Lineolata rhizophorae]
MPPPRLGTMRPLWARGLRVSRVVRPRRLTVQYGRTPNECYFFHSTTSCFRSSAERTPNSASGGSSATQSKRRSYRRTVLFAAPFLLLGVFTGSLFTTAVAPPSAPPSGSRDDVVFLSALESDIDALPTVQELRRERGRWRELPSEMSPQLADYANAVLEKEQTADEKERRTSLTRETIAGSHLLGPARRFVAVSPNTGSTNGVAGTEVEMVSVRWIGPALAGWPGVTHGGALATVLQEEGARAVALGTPVAVDDAEDGVPLDTTLREPSSFTIAYRKPTMAGEFYVVRAIVKPLYEAAHKLEEEVDEDWVNIAKGEQERPEDKGFLGTGVGPSISGMLGWVKEGAKVVAEEVAGAKRKRKDVRVQLETMDGQMTVQGEGVW